MKDRRQPETLRLRHLMPALTVDDLAASIAWYRDLLGFVVQEEMHRDGVLAAARLQAGSVQLLLGQDDFAKGRDRPKGAGFRLYGVTSQDVDKLAAQVRQAGGSLAQEPTDQPWGARDFAVEDPDGYKISITTEPPTS